MPTWMAVLAFFGTVGVLYLIGIWMSAFLDTKSAPRRPMIWCGKHGALLEEYQINFMGEKVCSICFHEKLKTAENAGK